MRKRISLFLKILSAFALAVFLLLWLEVIWTSPPYYEPSRIYQWSSPILPDEAYSTILGEHPRPYIYRLGGGQKGEVYILGIEHSKDPQNPQIDSVYYWWNKANPTAVLVEGRLGFLFSWFQNPVKTLGEQGYAARLAKKHNTGLFTWEPDKGKQVQLMVEKYDAKKVALFFSLRPYFSNFRFGKPENPEQKMNEYIKSRTDYPEIRGLIKGWEEIDSIWKADFPNEKDWRDFSDEWGWPEGYLSEMASYSNMLRDIHLCNSIIDLAEKGETVFATMGSSHAVRVQGALQSYFGGNRSAESPGD
ncbi:MAG: hypothetical protein IPH04_04290 [Saprospirales bacterium]|nr:hypothetical protein [Saprospirales bacterium]